MFKFEEGKYYRLADVRDLFGRSKAPLTVEFQFGGVEHIIEPGGELLVHPPERPERRRKQ